MKIYRIIVRIVATILGILFAVQLLITPTAQTAIKDPVTEGYYDKLKVNALNVAKTLNKNVINDETLTADFYFNQNELVVTVSSMKANLIAKIPISNNSLNIEDGTIISKWTVEFENIEYVEETELLPAWRYIAIAIIAGALIAILILLLFEMWFASKKHK